MRLSMPSRNVAGDVGARASTAATWAVPIEALFLLATFLVVVAPTSALAAIGRFDGLYGQDPYAYADYAALLRGTDLLHLLPLPPFYWPPGYPLAVALVSSLGLPVPLAGRIVSAVSGGLVPVFTYLLAKEFEPLTVVGCRRGVTQRGPTVSDRGRMDEAASAVGSGGMPAISRGAPIPASPGTAEPVSAIGHRLSAQSEAEAASGEGLPLVPAVAALAVACQGQLWQSSAVVMADTLGLAAATAGVWGLARYGNKRSVPWLLLASAAMSLAILARWAYALVAIPCAIYAAVVLARQRRGEAARDLLAAAAVGAAILAPMLVPALAGLGHDPRGAPFSADLQVYTWSPLTALRRTFVTADGLLSYRLPNGVYYALAPARPVFFTPLLAPLALAGLWCVARKPTLEVVALVAGWAAVVYAFHAGAPWQNFRFTLAYLPPLAILMALGAAALAGTLRRRGGLALRAVLAVGLLWMAASGALLVRGFIAQKDADLATVAWLDDRIPPTARVLTFGLTETVRHYSGHPVTDLSEVAPSDLSLLEDGRDSAYVLLDVQNVETQWSGRAPSLNYHWLLDRHFLVRRGERAPYVLDQVCSATVACVGSRGGPG